MFRLIINKIVSILRWSEKYTKTDMLYIAKGGSWLIIGQFVSTGTAFLLSVAFANLLSPDTYGTYKFILSIYSLLIITTLSGMDSAIIQSVSRGFDGTMKVGLMEKFRWGLYGSIGSVIISFYYFYNANFLLGFCFLIVSFFIPFTESTDTYNSMLWGKKLFNIQAKYNVINILITLFSLSTALYFTDSIYVILLTYLLSLTIPNLFFVWNTNKYYKSNDSVDDDSIRYGKKLSLIGILALLFSQLDKILVFHYIGPANLAIYSLAVAPTDQIKGLMKNLNSLAMPQLANRNIGEIKKNLWSKVIILSLITTLIVLLYILFAPLFFATFFPKYVESVIYSQILSLSLIPVVVAGFLYTILESQKAEQQIYKYNIYGNAFGVIILFPLVYYYGIWGAISGRVLTRFFFTIYALHLTNKTN